MHLAGGVYKCNRCEEADAYCCNKCIASAASQSRRGSVGADSTALFVPVQTVSARVYYVTANYVGDPLAWLDLQYHGETMQVLFRYKMMIMELTAIYLLGKSYVV